MSSWSEVGAVNAERLEQTPEILRPLFVSSAKQGRVLENDCGLWAVVLERSSIEREIKLAPKVSGKAVNYRKAAFVFGFQREMEQASVLVSLLRHCDLFVVPADRTDLVGNRFEACGQFDFEPATDRVSMLLLRSKPVQAATLTTDAPLGQGELDDNLGDREEWFRKRHGGK